MQSQRPTISDADIVPEVYQMRLLAWRDELTRGYFEVGDIANDLIMTNIKKGSPLSNFQIYSAVGRFCGKSGRTIRDWAEVSAFFPEELRKEYDVLPFAHFRFAKSCSPRWQEVLEYSLNHPDATEEKLLHEFKGVAVGVAVGDDESVAVSVSADEPESVAVGDVAVSESVSAWLPGIYVLANLISQAETILSWEIKTDTRRKLLLALDSLKDVLHELSEKEPSLKYAEYPQDKA